MKKTFDLVLGNGAVVEGTSSPGFQPEVGLMGDKMVATGCLADRDATRVMDATGDFVTPGFTDEHSRSDV